MIDPVRLAQVFVGLADTLVEEFDVVDLLQVLTEQCVELLHVDAAGIMLADQRGTLQLIAGTVEQSRSLELFELQIDEGPCPDCFRDGKAITNLSLSDAQERWPQFTPAAIEAGYRSTHAMPMRLRTQIIGALNLFNHQETRLDSIDLSVGQALADVATIGLLHERNLREQTVLSEQLQNALNTRVLIEQAKGVLAARSTITVNEAFIRLRSHARRHGLTLTSVAQNVIDGSLDLELVPS